MNARIGSRKQLPQADGYQARMRDLPGAQWFSIEYEEYVRFATLPELETRLLYAATTGIPPVVVTVGEKRSIFESSLTRMNQRQKTDFCLARTTDKAGLVTYDDAATDCAWIGFLLAFAWLESMTAQALRPPPPLVG